MVCWLYEYHYCFIYFNNVHTGRFWMCLKYFTFHFYQFVDNYCSFCQAKQYNANCNGIWTIVRNVHTTNLIFEKIRRIWNQ